MQIGLGTATFGMAYGIANSGTMSIEEAFSILSYAEQNGLTMLDTAQLYGDSEKVLGQYQGIKNFQIVSKLPSIAEFAHHRLVSDAEQSLMRLKIESLHALLLHEPQDLLVEKGSENFDKLSQLKEQQLTRKIGVSVYTPQQLSDIIDMFPIDIVQLPLNVFDQRFIQSGILTKAKARGIEIHVRSVFLQGLLLMNTDQLPDHFIPFKTQIDDYFSAIKAKHIGKLTAALAFIAQQAEIDYSILGCCSRQQVSEFLSALDNKPTIDYSSYASNDESLIIPTNWN